jgi:hypothetical protein
MRRRLAFALVTGITLLTLAACSSSSSDSGQASEGPATSKLTDLRNMLALRAAFNADRGRTRLLLLLSPT